MQHLKSKFDSGYVLTVQLAGQQDGRSQSEDDGASAPLFLVFMRRICPLARLVEGDVQASHLVLSIPR